MRRKKKNLIPILILLLLGISLGYALLSQDLTITGTSKVKGNTWDIHFDNVIVNSNSVPLSTGDVAATINASDETLVEYTVTLNLPGDFYEFTVDAVNEGTVDGMIGSITSKLNGTAISTTNPLPDYLDYSVTYENGTEIEDNQLIAAGNTLTYKVRVEFKRDIENSELPSTLQTNAFSFEVSYVQADSNAVALPPEILTIYTLWPEVGIGKPLSYISGTYYTSAEELRAAHNNTPYYIKSIAENDIVTDGYVEFIITPEEAAQYPDLTAGTYALRGIKAENDETGGCYPEYVDSTDNGCYSPYFDSNMEIMQTAIDASHCTMKSNDRICECEYGGWLIYVNKWGHVEAYKSGFGYVVAYNSAGYSYSGNG